MQGLKRKLVFITAYELIGWVISSVALAILSGNSAGVTGPLALAITTNAGSWNFIFNTLFEFWVIGQFNTGFPAGFCPDYFYPDLHIFL